MVIVHISPDVLGCFMIGFQLLIQVLIQEVLFGASEKAAALPGRVIKLKCPSGLPLRAAVAR